MPYTVVLIQSWHRTLLRGFSKQQANANYLQGDQYGADRDCRVCNIECTVVPTGVVKIKKVNDVPVNDAVYDVADCASDNQPDCGC